MHPADRFDAFKRERKPAVHTSEKGCTVALFQGMCCSLFVRLATISTAAAYAVSVAHDLFLPNTPHLVSNRAHILRPADRHQLGSQNRALAARRQGRRPARDIGQHRCDRIKVEMPARAQSQQEFECSLIMIHHLRNKSLRPFSRPELNLVRPESAHAR
jgi:hypothetical protein